MTWVVNGEFSMIWWNTGLTPPIIRKKMHATVGDLLFVTEQLEEMYETFDFALLGLAEVSPGNLTHIMESFSKKGFDIAVSPSRNGRLIYDTALIYNRYKLDLQGPSAQFVDRHGKTRLKTGEMATFTELGSGNEIYVAVSHWPSRARMNEQDPIRAEYGKSLRDSAITVSNGKNDPYIVLMGDYNDEPLSPSLASSLLASRDRSLVKKLPGYYYNPFWRLLGESHPHGVVVPTASVCGTYFHKDGNYTEWVTIDQIIFSAAFLTDGSLVLDEDKSRIISSPVLTERVVGPYVSDHYPVLSSFHSRTKNHA